MGTLKRKDLDAMALHAATQWMRPVPSPTSAQLGGASGLFTILLSLTPEQDNKTASVGIKIAWGTLTPLQMQDQRSWRLVAVMQGIDFGRANSIFWEVHRMPLWHSPDPCPIRTSRGAEMVDRMTRLVQVISRLAEEDHDEVVF